MKLKLLLLGLIPIAIITSCVPEKTTDPNGPNGFGYSTKPVSGTPWTLPSGINIQFGILTSPANGSSYNESQIDGTLEFYLILKNNNPTPATVMFPPGLIFPAPDTSNQNSLTVQADSVIVPGNDSYYYSISTFCINDHRTFSYGQTYGTPVVSDNANLQPLYQLLANKHYVTNYTNVQELQQAIWDIADSGKLSPVDITNINAFP